MDSTKFHGATGYWAAWLLVFAIGAWFRLWRVGMQIVIDDEWHAINTLKSSGYLDILTSFGYADHSIPLTLYYELLANTIGLTEWGLRIPMLIAGMATVVLVPWLFRHWLTRVEQLTAGALLAISPALIHFSRTARPYAITLLLSILAMWALYRWWHNPQRKYAWFYAACTVLAAYLHLLTLAFTFACLLWAGIKGLVRAGKHKEFGPLIRTTKLGFLTFLGCAVFLAAPLIHDFTSLAAKAGVHHVTFQTLAIAWQSLTGTGYVTVSVAAFAFALYGGVVLYRRDAELVRFLVFVLSIALLLVVCSEAAWLKYGRLLLRYSLPTLAVALLFMAVGMVSVFRSISAGRWRYIIPGAGAAICVAGLYLAGPLGKIYNGLNQFTGHQVYQFDYNYSRNTYRQYLAPVKIPPVYFQIKSAGLGPGWEIIEAPWRLESFWNPLPIYQRVHQLPIRIGFMSGLCSKPFYGEYGPGKTGLQFEYFVHLKELLANPGEKRFLIFHLKPALEEMRQIPDVRPCVGAFRARFGPPWYVSDRVVVFRFAPSREGHG